LARYLELLADTPLKIQNGLVIDLEVRTHSGFEHIAVPARRNLF